MSYLLGIDSGLTVTKAVLFDESGHQVRRAEARVAQHTPRPRWVERDVQELRDATVKSIRTVLTDVAAGDVAAVGVTGHGDGVYLVDDAGRPTRRGILSLDSRAFRIVEEWSRTGVSQEAFGITGQMPLVSSTAALLAWLQRNEPGTLEESASFLSCKDLIRYFLTEGVSTDPTDASTSFTELKTQQYSNAAFEAYGLAGLRRLAPPVLGSMSVTGGVTPSAGDATGLLPGTPVVSGMHDVDACAVGTGCTAPGRLSLVAGTYSINQVVSDRPQSSELWNARNFVVPGLWMNMAVSPASATNLEWFVQQLGAAEVGTALAQGRDVFDVVSDEVAGVGPDRDGLVYLPFLFGSPIGPTPSAAFLGLRGWHTRAHLLRAVFEGVVFNHRWHVEALRACFCISSARLAGGAARSEVWSQMFADALQMSLGVVETTEPGALGAALAAGVGAGVYSSLDDAVEQAVRVTRHYVPRDDSVTGLEELYRDYRRAVQALEPFWNPLPGR